MLKQRVLTAGILIPLIALAILFASNLVFSLITTLIVLLAGWEWPALTGMQTLQQRVAFLFILFVALLLVNYCSPAFVLSISVVFWSFVVIYLSMPTKPESLPDGVGLLVKYMVGVLVLVPCWVAFNMLHNDAQGSLWLFTLLFIVCGADSAAYFTGKYFGKRKLAPLISPGKTIEGALGALVVVFFLAWIVGSMLFKLKGWQMYAWLILSQVIVIVSIVGDLFESILKRQQNLKDSGNLLPGHGGVLDRLDSLTAAAPFYALSIWWLGLISPSSVQI